MKVLNPIRRYIRAKQASTAHKQINAVKAAFFKAIENLTHPGEPGLSVVSVLHLLNNNGQYPQRPFDSIFYRERSSVRFATASVDSGAAKQLRQLLASLGCTVADEAMRELVAQDKKGVGEEGAFAGLVNPVSIVTHYLSVLDDTNDFTTSQRLHHLQREWAAGLRLTGDTNLAAWNKVLLDALKEADSTLWFCRILEVSRQAYRQAGKQEYWKTQILSYMRVQIAAFEAGDAGAGQQVSVLLDDHEIARYVAEHLDDVVLLSNIRHLLPPSVQPAEAKDGHDEGAPFAARQPIKTAKPLVKRMHAHKENNAVAVIQGYLGKKRWAHKQLIFRDIERAINTNGLTVDTLNHALNANDRNMLFKRRWLCCASKKSSQSAAVMFRLYTIALGRSLTTSEQDAIVYGENEEKHRFLPKSVAVLRDQAEKAVVEGGAAVEEKTAVLQVRVLDDASIERVVQAVPRAVLRDEGSDDESKESVAPAREAMLRFDTNGHQLIQHAQGDDRVTMSVDALPQLTEQYRQWFLQGDDLTVQHGQKMQAVINRFIDCPSRHSVINLQLEAEMHMAMGLRRILANYYSAAAGGMFNETVFQRLLETAGQEVNEAIREAFRDALLVATSDNTHDIDIHLLNGALDKARVTLLPKTEEAVVNALRASSLNYEQVGVAIDALTKADFESHTATDGHGFIYTNSQSKTAVWVQGSKCTAHDKQTGGNHLALRVVKRFDYDPDTRHLRALSTGRIEARVPSIAPKKYADGSKVEASDAIKDVADKFAHAQRVLSAEGEADANMVYNLLTSLHTAAWDKAGDNGNDQRKSADRILVGSHRYNALQITRGGPLALVCNIPVNQHTNSLDLEAFDTPTAEASLMAEVAILNTLNERSYCLSALERLDVQSMHETAQQAYTSFLVESKGPLLQDAVKKVYFHQSDIGKAFKRRIAGRNVSHKMLHDKCDDAIFAGVSESTEQLVTKALYRIHALGLHRQKQYGLLVQSMLGFLQSKSISGCKSANERWISFDSRKHMFHLMAHADDAADVDVTSEMRAVKQAMVSLCMSTNDEGEALAENSLRGLQKSVDDAVERHCLYGANMFVSEDDQGAAPKNERFSSDSGNSGWFIRHPVEHFHSNYMETMRGWSQRYASPWQAHKGDHAAAYQRKWGELPAYIPPAAGAASPVA